MAARFEISERRVGNVTIFDMAGRLVAADGDLQFCARADALLAAGERNLLLNLRDVTVLDSGGLGALVRCYVRLRRRGGDLKLVNLTDRTRRVLAVTRLLTVFQAFDSEGEALASFAGHELPETSTAAS